MDERDEKIILEGENPGVMMAPKQEDHTERIEQASGWTRVEPDQSKEAHHQEQSFGQYHQQNGQTGKPKQDKGRSKKIISIVLIVVLAAAAGFGGGIAAITIGQNIGWLGGGNQNVTIKSNGQPVDQAEAIATKVIPSVVGISTKQEVTYQSFFGQQSQTQEGVGTGIIVDTKGFILTNSHVVGDGKVDAITVQLSDGREVSGNVLWNDKNIDLAIVKIEATGLTAAELGDSDEMKIGSYAVAIGNPLGLTFAGSLTQGVISGLNRSITVSENGQNSTIDNLMQTDASINSGNSGGPLLNSEGQVIGINTAKVQNGEGLGFAIPINTAKPIVEEIKAKGEFQRSYIGISGVNVAQVIEAYPEQDFGVESGVYIAQIYTQSPAADAGLKEGDIITTINEKEIETMSELISTLYSYRPGDKVTLKVVRDKQTMTKEVTLVPEDKVTTPKVTIN